MESLNCENKNNILGKKVTRLKISASSSTTGNRCQDQLLSSFIDISHHQLTVVTINKKLISVIDSCPYQLTVISEGKYNWSDYFPIYYPQLVKIVNQLRISF